MCRAERSNIRSASLQDQNRCRKSGFRPRPWLRPRRPVSVWESFARHLLPTGCRGDSCRMDTARTHGPRQTPLLRKDRVTRHGQERPGRRTMVRRAPRSSGRVGRIKSVNLVIQIRIFDINLDPVQSARAINYSCSSWVCRGKFYPSFLLSKRDFTFEFIKNKGATIHTSNHFPVFATYWPFFELFLLYCGSAQERKEGLGSVPITTKNVKPRKSDCYYFKLG